jgi:hypothetical protein
MLVLNDVRNISHLKTIFRRGSVTESTLLSADRRLVSAASIAYDINACMVELLKMVLEWNYKLIYCTVVTIETASKCKCKN